MGQGRRNGRSPPKSHWRRTECDSETDWSKSPALVGHLSLPHSALVELGSAINLWCVGGESSCMKPPCTSAFRSPKTGAGAGLGATDWCSAAQCSTVVRQRSPGANASGRKTCHLPGPLVCLLPWPMTERLRPIAGAPTTRYLAITQRRVLREMCNLLEGQTVDDIICQPPTGVQDRWQPTHQRLTGLPGGRQQPLDVSERP